MSRLPALLAALLLLVSVAPAASADEAPHPVSIRVDGRLVAFPDAQPLMSNGRILVPVRFVSEALDAQVGWDEQARTVTLTQGAKYVRLYPTESCGLTDCNGPTLEEQQNRLACLSADCTEAVLIDVAPRILGVRTYVPLRFVAEALGAEVGWDQSSWTADLTSNKGTGFSTTSVQVHGLPASGQIDAPVNLTVESRTPGTLLQVYAIDPVTRKGYLLGASPSVTAPLTINGHAVPAGCYLVAAGVWSVDRWIYSYPELITFAPTGDPWSGERRAWLSGYPDALLYRYQMSVSALANFPRSTVTWLYSTNGKVEPQPGTDLSFNRTFTPADNGEHSLQAILTPADGGAPITTDKISFRVDVRPIRTDGLARDQVVTTPVTINAVQDGSFTAVEYRVTRNYVEIIQSQTLPADQPFQLDPAASGEGAFTLVTIGHRADGSTVEAVGLPFYAWPGGEALSPTAATPAEQQAFLERFRPIAMAIYAQTGLSPSLQLAQAIHESGWGKAEATDIETGQRSFNLFGLKAGRGDSMVRQLTVEFEDGVQNLYLAPFRRFGSEQEAWQARAQYLLGSRLFAPIGMVRSNPNAVLDVLYEFGYATDPDYAVRVRAILDQKGLLPNGESLRSLDRIQF